MEITDASIDIPLIRNVQHSDIQGQSVTKDWAHKRFGHKAIIR